MTIDVEYTAQLRVKTGMASQAFDLADGACVKDLLDAVSGQHDIQEFLAGSLLCFVGSSQAEPTQPLSDGARVTLLTPISGG
jgi:molybdopterin converting factor small subunit